MNLYNIWVSFSEMSDKNIYLFHDIQFLFLILNNDNHKYIGKWLTAFKIIILALCLTPQQIVAYI